MFMTESRERERERERECGDVNCKATMIEIAKARETRSNSSNI